MSCNGWKTCKLSELAVVKGGKRLPKDASYADYKTRHPYIRLVDIKNGRISDESIQYLDEKVQSYISKYIVEENDVCLAIVGHTIGMVFYVDQQWHASNLTENAARLTKFNNAEPKYLYYYLISDMGQNEIRKNMVGSAQGKLPIYGIQNIEIQLPPLHTQRRIADILSALDDKIELNRQTNITLEAMAQAIFKEWFVDFRFPGATGDLVDSELGLIPRGWRVGKIGELFDFVIGGDWGKDEHNNEYSNLCAVIRGTDLNDIMNAQTNKVPRRFIKTSNLNKRELREGDIVLEISGGSKDQATGRNLLITNEVLDLFNEKVIPASFCRLIRAKDMAMSVFLGTYLRLLYANGGTWDYQIQSTGISNFQFADFENREKLSIPPYSVLDSFKEKVLSIYQAIGQTNQQSVTLTQLRDNLLPKLMSGEISLDEAEIEL